MLLIEELKASAVRNLNNFNIKPAQKLNYFYGPNASGKTSVLELIYLLSHAKSFRSRRIYDVIRQGERCLSVFAQGKNQLSSFNLGIEKGYGLTRLKRNGENILTASELAKTLPVFLLTPEHYQLFQAGPKQRRHWLDWSLFHVKHTYLDSWKNYHKALRHRNAIIKSSDQTNWAGAQSWEKIMSEEAQKIDQDRLNYLQELSQELSDNQLNIVLTGTASIHYKNSCSGDELFNKLVETRREDSVRGYTADGPHRADVVFEYDNFNVAKHLSRGQVKLFGAALISAQVTILKNLAIYPLMLVDDIDAELDSQATKRILRLLKNNDIQTFITSLEKHADVESEPDVNEVFHVEHGCVNKS